MTTVEDGEILEMDNDGVIDLCSDAEPAEPGPTPASPPKPNLSRSRIRRNIAAFRANVYRGGDPFSYVLNAQVDVDRTSADKPHLPRTSTPYDQPYDARNSLNGSHSAPRPYLPNKEPFLQRNPYAAENPMTPALPNDVTEPSHAHNQSFHGRIPSRGELDASPLSTAARSRDAMWPYPASHDGSGIQLGPHAELHPGSQQGYDPERYSPGREQEQSRFTNGAIYHAEPGPPPSVQYSMHHQSVMPADPSFRGMPFEMTQKQRLHPMNQVHDPPPSIYNNQSFSGIVRTEQGFFTRDNPEVIERYQSKTESVIGFRREREILQNRQRQLHQKRESSFQQESYDPRFPFDAHHRSVSDTALEGEANAFDESERRRIRAEPVKSSVPSEDAHRANSAESRDSHERLGCTYGGSGSEDCHQGRSVPRREQFQRCPPPLEGDSSDGEISSPPVPSPVMSLATAPDETPSPPSVKKKKPTGIDAKKRLLELRKKALMSVKKRPTAQNSHGSVQPISPRPRCSPPLGTSESAEGFEELQGVSHTQNGHDNAKNDGVDIQDMHKQFSYSSGEVIRGARIQTDSLMQVVIGGVQRTMTRVQFTQWQEWPYQNRIVVDYSSDSSDNTDGTDSEDERLESNAAVQKKSHRSPLYSREREIEAMKIRMVCLGKCPSMLTGEPKKLKSASGSPRQHIVQKSEGGANHVSNVGTVTKVLEESTRSEIVQNKSKHDAGDKQVVDREDAFSLEQACVSKGTESRPHVIPPKLTTGHSKNVKPTTVSCRSPVSVSSAENRITSEHLKKLELVPDDHSEKTKNELVHDDKLSSNQTPSKEMNKKESTAQVKTPRPSVATYNERPIAELKRRIAAMEKSRDLLKQQRHKKQRVATDEETTGSRSRNGVPRRRPSHRNTNLIVDRKQISQVSKPEKSERPSTEGDNRERVHYQRSSRYYGPKSSSSLQSLSALKKGDAADVAVDVPEVCCDVSDSSARTTLQGASEPTPEMPEDNAQRRYIDDLKLELEQKRKELMDERDRAEQLRTAEVAIAEAQAKLNFTRSRVADLQEELRKAGLDVIDAEKEYRRIIKVAAQLRDASSGELTELDSEQEYQGRVHYSPEISGNGGGNVSNHPAIEESSDIDKGQGEIDDYVLRPSPYSPSTGDYFTSCLRAFRAYLLRIPHHSKAKDRMAGSILSLTWGATLDPMKAICPQELRGQCSSKECDFQHLKVFKTPRDRALQVIEGIEGFFSAGDREKEAKLIINTRIAIHEGKDATATISSLISKLCASSKTVPYSCASE